MSFEKLQKSVTAIRAVTDFEPEIAVVLGSGLGDFAKNAEMVSEINYSDIEGFPTSTVTGHEGKFIFGYVSGKKVVIMQGRVHYYEGYDIADVVMPVRIMGMLGAKKLILTNAAGGINESFKAGDFMMLTDHISSLVPSPLRGKNIDELGVRFPDMTKVYSPEIRDIIKKAARENNIPLREGVYIQTPGPNYETPAEINMYRICGADAVGMSTACEAMAARHMGMEIGAISCISNMAAGLNKEPLTHQEVKDTANRVAKQFEILIDEIIKNL